jgi:hypothetical protein
MIVGLPLAEFPATTIAPIAIDVTPAAVTIFSVRPYPAPLQRLTGSARSFKRTSRCFPNVPRDIWIVEYLIRYA